jgi:hypothetical protein
MFLEILQTLIKVLIVFSILIIAFGLAFYILLSRVSSELQHYLSINKQIDTQRARNHAIQSFSGNSAFIVTKKAKKIFLILMSVIYVFLLRDF